MSPILPPLSPGLAHPAPRQNRSVGPVAAPPRFTLDGDDGLERRLAEICRTVMAGIRGLIPGPRLEAVLLGGGYGRGEGGVLRTPEGDRPYNDLEFYVCLRGNRHLNERRHHLPLHVLGEILTPMSGVEIEFKIISLAELRRSGISMFSYDLLMGHRWLSGSGGLLFGFSHHRHAGDIPAAEATRLLMNRCSGLLFAQARLERPTFAAADADFVQRNLAKAELAFGDAMLTAHGQYHWSCRERAQRLHRLYLVEPVSWLDEVRRRHEAGVQFKLHPGLNPATRTDLAAQWAAVADLGCDVWLWQEQRRLGIRFPSARDYVESRIDRSPETPWHRNILVNLKSSGPGALFKTNPCRHPRNRVLRELCLLLWGRGAEPVRTAAFFADRIAAYQALWRRVN